VQIAHAQPGIYSKLDYRKADIWSVGVMACEIFAAGRESVFADWLKHVANKKPTRVDTPPMFDSKLCHSSVVVFKMCCCVDVCVSLQDHSRAICQFIIFIRVYVCFSGDELSRCVGKVVKAMLSADPAEVGLLMYHVL
jgi:hypothetical protein